jgi:excisionase family DNA binding protein
MSSAAAAESYRRADLRLRLLLFGDGADVAPFVKGELPRQLVANEIRHLRDAFEALLERESEARREIGEAASALESELRRTASIRARTDRAARESALLTPAEAAERLHVSPSSVYRAIRRGDIRASRAGGSKPGPIRIPETEVQRLLESEPG